MRLLFAPVLCALLAFAQSSPEARTPRRTRPDAGAGPVRLGPDPPGKLRPSAPSDGGTIAQVDAGPTPTEIELQQLRSRVDALERERAVLEEQTQQLSRITQQLQQLRAQLADAEAARQDEARQQSARREQLQGGVNALYAAQNMLAGGNFSVEDQLSQAQGSFPPQAQRDIEAARAAIQNRDLSQARTYLNAAISDAQQGK